MKQLPWLPWRVARWRNSPRVLAMSLAARGAFFELLQAAWELGGKLPNAPTILWRYAHASSPAEFEAVASEVLGMFSVSDDGKFLTNDTLSEEWQDAENRMEHVREVRSAAGKKGNEKRWQDRKIAKRSQPIARDSQRVAHDSSSTGQEHDTTKPKPAAAGPAPLELIEGFRSLVTEISQRVIVDIWSRCRQTVPDCTAEEILMLAERKLAKASGVRNPVGFLKVCLSDWFEVEQVTQLRAERKQLAAQERKKERQQAAEAEEMRREIAADQAAEDALRQMSSEHRAALQELAEQELRQMPELRNMLPSRRTEAAWVLMRKHLKGEPWPSERKKPGRVAAAG